MDRSRAEAERTRLKAMMAKDAPTRKASRTGANPETVLMKAIEEALAWRCKGRLKLWRNNTGATKTASGGFLRFGAVGSADLLGVLGPEGRLVALEVKQLGKKPTQLQLDWLAEVRALGGIAAVVYSPEDAIRALEPYLQEPAPVSLSAGLATRPARVAAPVSAGAAQASATRAATEPRAATPRTRAATAPAKPAAPAPAAAKSPARAPKSPTKTKPSQAASPKPVKKPTKTPARKKG